MDHDELLDRIRQGLADGKITAEDLEQLKPTKPRGRPPKKALTPKSTRPKGGQIKYEQRELFALLWPILATHLGKQRAKDKLLEVLNYADLRSIEKHRARFERRQRELGLEIFEVDLPDGRATRLYLSPWQAKIFRRRLASGETSLTRLTLGFGLESIIDLPMNPEKIE